MFEQTGPTTTVAIPSAPRRRPNVTGADQPTKATDTHPLVEAAGKAVESRPQAVDNSGDNWCTDGHAAQPVLSRTAEISSTGCGRKFHPQPISRSETHSSAPKSR